MTLELPRSSNAADLAVGGVDVGVVDVEAILVKAPNNDWQAINFLWTTCIGPPAKKSLFLLSRGHVVHENACGYV